MPPPALLLRCHSALPLPLQLHVAQLGGVDLQGYLSKFNPDAAEQGIFTQDWELRFFVLSGACYQPLRLQGAECVCAESRLLH